MKTFVTVIQDGAGSFDVHKFDAETQHSLFPQTSKVGIVITVFESNEQNDKFCKDMAERMCITTWLEASEHSDYVSADWDGEVLEIFKDRQKSPEKMDRKELVELGVLS